jgi:hypothetical protein
MYIHTEHNRAKKRISIGLRRFVKGEGIKLDNFQNEILRYIKLSRTDFRSYIEHQFIDGMTWDNYCIDWEIDHIVPASLFDMLSNEDLSLCWHYLNLMPMWSKDNEIKANSLYFTKIILEQRISILSYNKVLISLKDKIAEYEDLHVKYEYDLDFLKFFNRINYH